MQPTSKHSCRYIFLLLLVLLSQSLPACRPSKTALLESESVATSSSPSVNLAPTQEKTGVTTIYFATYDSARYTFKTLAEEFQTLNPDIRVEVLAIEDVIGNAPLSYAEQMYRIVTASDAGLWYVDHFATRAGLLRDLTPYIEMDASFVPEDFFPHILAAFQWEGGTWALPFPSALGLIYYAQHAFDAAGLASPQAGWTLEDFLRTAQRLTIREEENVVRYGYVDQLGIGLESFILSQVGSLFDESTGLPDLSREDVQRAVGWYSDLALTYGVMPNPETELDVSAFELIQAGKAAMWSATPTTTYGPDMRVQTIGVVPFPEVNSPSNWVAMNGYFVSAGTQHSQESWRWLNFLTHRSVAAWDKLLPARRSVAEQTQYWRQFDPEEASAVQYAAEHLNVVLWDEASVALSKGLAQIFKGESIETVLAAAQATALAQIHQSAQATPKPVMVMPPASLPTVDETSITFAPALHIGRQPNWTALAEAFSHIHPEIRVKIVDQRMSGTVDCFADYVPVLENTAPAAQYLNLQPLLEMDPTFSLDGIPTHFLEAFRAQGGVWGVPLQAQVYVIFYNRALFDAAGISYPQPGWTWDDFLITAQKLTWGRDLEKRWGFVPFNAPPNDLRVFLAARGIELWDAQGQPRFDAPDVVSAVTWYVNLTLKHQVTPAFPEDFPEPDTATWETRKTLLRQGRVAMWSDYTLLDRRDVWPIDAEIGIAPLPRAPNGEGKTEFSYEGLFIAANTPNAQLCWEWLKFIENQGELIYSFPARSHLLTAPFFQTQIGADATATYTALLEYQALSRPSSAELGQLYWLYTAVGEVLNGAPPASALAQAQQQVR